LRILSLLIKKYKREFESSRNAENFAMILYDIVDFEFHTSSMNIEKKYVGEILNPGEFMIRASPFFNMRMLDMFFYSASPFNPVLHILYNNRKVVATIVDRSLLIWFILLLVCFLIILIHLVNISFRIADFRLELLIPVMAVGGIMIVNYARNRYVTGKMNKEIIDRLG